MNSTTFRRWLSAGVFAAAGLFGASAQAGPYSDLIIFGDSLSDTGNVFIVTGGALPSQSAGPYAGGRFSNGPLWVETLANGLGLPTVASPILVGGNYDAFAGAKTGVEELLDRYQARERGVSRHRETPYSIHYLT